MLHLLMCQTGFMTSIPSHLSLDSDVRNVQVVGYVLSVSPRVHEGYIIVSVSTDEKFVNGYYEI